MAYNIEALPDYVQERRDEILRKVVFGGKAIDRLSWMTDVKTNANINILSTEVVFQDGESCGFTPQGDTVFNNRVVVTKPIKINQEYCAKDLLRAFTQYTVRIAADAEALPFEGYIMSEIAEKANKRLEEILWTGDEGLGINGVVKEYELAEQDYVTVSGSAYDKIMQVYNALPVDILDKAVIFVGKDTYRAFVQDMVNKNFYHYNAGDATDEFVLPATNVKVVAEAGLNGTGLIVGTDPKNLVYATDVTSADEIVDVWYSKDDRTNKIAIEFNAGFQIAFPDLMKIGKVEDSSEPVQPETPSEGE